MIHISNCDMHEHTNIFILIYIYIFVYWYSLLVFPIGIPCLFGRPQAITVRAVPAPTARAAGGRLALTAWKGTLFQALTARAAQGPSAGSLRPQQTLAGTIGFAISLVHKAYQNSKSARGWMGLQRSGASIWLGLLS